MKTIVLMPVKNENWILDLSISSATQYADHILIADQNSTDNSIEIAKSYEKVDVITNNRVGHSNQIRWELLDTAREKYGKNNLVVCIDADELVPHVYFNKIKDKMTNGIPPGKMWITAPWIQLWRSVYTYRNDSSVWSPRTNKKPFAFVDDGAVDYNRSFVINDHTSRVPGAEGTPLIETNMPLIHFQFANWQRAQEKQAWYRCKELLHGSNASNINQKYSITKDESNIQLTVIPEKWYDGLTVEASREFLTKPSWYVQEIEDMFKAHGIERFFTLDIWHIDSIKKLQEK